MANAKLVVSLLFCSLYVQAQVYSPVVLKKGQADPTNLKAMARGIFAQSAAVTPREKAEAIWRFFLTDGRFVKPGFWYHIAGWAYEEPRGEVLDPIKLMNSYGFGLCYQIAPLLADLWEAGGVGPARVWFLTGHTVAEVFYDGAYHYFDSDMMGYNSLDTGPLKRRPVASVHQLEQDPTIILGKLTSPHNVDNTAVDQPWYPADVRANAMGGLAKLFTSTEDNWVFPFERAPQGHTMDFVIRPGERIIRYFQPETLATFYLPQKFDGTSWHEFPQQIAEYNIRTQDGPKSQKDSRSWATGVIEYRPPAPQAVYRMPSPYVIIDAHFEADVHFASKGGTLSAETSTDGGKIWVPAIALTGPLDGQWKANSGSHSVAGSYGYLIRFQAHGATLSSIVLTTRFQLNPRTLPELTSGSNELEYHTGIEHRTTIPVRTDNVAAFAAKSTNITYAGDRSQGYVINKSPQQAQLIFEVATTDSVPLTGFDAGGHFLDLRDGLAPDKFTAEVRSVAPWPAKNTPEPAASVSWALSPLGPYKTLWMHDPKLVWKDGQPLNRTLRWPEVDRSIRDLPAGTQRVYVRYQIRGMAIDDFRLAAISAANLSSSALQITHLWRENGQSKKYVQSIASKQATRKYSVQTSDTATIVNEAVIMESPEKN